MIIDATDTMLGRVASYAAKKALMGEQVTILNCEKSVVSGSRAYVLAKYAKKTDMGTPRKGPFFHRKTIMIMKRTVRGMLPHANSRAKEALSRVKCFDGVPEEFAGKKAEILKNANVSKLTNIKITYLGELSRLLGGRK
ncbi:MAG: 50S ribosomal protein L13 [Candidatus Woesearchaeota archaeon]|nr:50S ribosomal protein L13 [Candidatus Woesearchaeota archaeon]